MIDVKKKKKLYYTVTVINHVQIIVHLLPKLIEQKRPCRWLTLTTHRPGRTPHAPTQSTPTKPTALIRTLNNACRMILLLPLTIGLPLLHGELLPRPRAMPARSKGAKRELSPRNFRQHVKQRTHIRQTGRCNTDTRFDAGPYACVDLVVGDICSGFR